MRTHACARRTRHSDEGAALVEFALVLPLLLMILVGTIEFGRVYNRQIAVQQAAREGARVLALRPNATAADVLTAENAAKGSVTGFTATAAGTKCPSSGNPRFAVMQVNTSVDVGIPFVFNKTLNLNGTARMRCGL